LPSEESPSFAVGETLSFEERPGDIAVLTLNRPDARNSLTAEVWRDLADALTSIESRQFRGVILTGRGPSFSAGGDLKSGPELGTRAFRKAGRVELAHMVLKRIVDFPVPIVAAVQGPALGVGWSLVLACDVIVAREDVYFSAPFSSVGAVPDGGLAWFLTNTIGTYRAAELIFSGRRLLARDALAWGLINSIVDTEIVEAATRIIEGFSRSSPDAVELSGNLINAAHGTTLDQFLALEVALAALAQSGPDAAEGRRAFTDKDEPAWRRDLGRED
jgi:2-(1,2-epoxy-1,2-dihydrophenyl)acetyl-CoA isomerase